ncbi:hypothetical protein [Microtetraspora malaysiensis]|uniref:hypothetical protein n=1 Tax=Microtetraspora malaysiensis TaxID=161358 RepID=UPI003D905DE9
MSGDLVTLVNELSPYVLPAVGAYGAAVLAKSQEEAADATVGWGRKILQKIFGIKEADEELPDEVAELAASPDDADLQAVLRVRIRKALEADPELAEEIRRMLREAASSGHTTVTASGRGVAAGRDITGPVTTGDNSPIIRF